MTQHDYADIALFIAGTWIGPEERETQPVINPATAQQIGLIAKRHTAQVCQSAS